LPAPRFAEEALTQDFQHPQRERLLAELLPRLAQHVDAFYTGQKPPSLAVAVVADGEVRLTRVLGLADVAQQVPASSHTLYRIGSITKTFTTALVLSLRDEGKLDLDRPAEQYWPELAQVRYPFPDSARITLRHLLTHTSGLRRLGNFDYAKPDAQVTEAVLLGALAEAELDNVPGAHYEYSNFGMSLVGYFAGRMSSEGSLRAAVAQRLTGPLGMASTSFDPASLPGAALATGYASHDPPTVAPLWNLGASEAAGGLWSSLDDMARWLSFQLSAWPARAEPERGPLRRATLREQHVAAFPIGLNAHFGGTTPDATATGVGLGWHTQQSCDYDQLVEHGGAIDGFKAAVSFLPTRGFGLVVLSNAIDTRVEQLKEQLVKLAADALPARTPQPAPSMLTALNALGANIGPCQVSHYEKYFSKSFRASVPLEQYNTICNNLARQHGRCELGETVSLSSPRNGIFTLRCERGSIGVNASVITEDGQPRFAGLRVRSTGFAAPPALAQAAKRALTMYKRWDDADYSATFANPGARDIIRAGFAQVRAEHGGCMLAPDALTGPYSDGQVDAILPIICERGGARELELHLDADGKLLVILMRDPARAPLERCR
jgi:CubicO group peptidase (beta-lactamase class C family)